MPKANFLAIAFAMSIAIAPVVNADPAPPKVREEIVSLSQQLMDAIGEGRKDVWQKIVADDAQVVDEFGRRQGKRDMVESLRPLPKGFSGSIEIRNARVTVYGDTAVIVCEEYERETVLGQKLVVRYIGTNAFVRRAGAWKLVAMEDVTLPTAPPKLVVPGLHLPDYAGIYSYGSGRTWTFTVHGGALSYTTKPGRPSVAAEPIALDVFMEGQGSDERNLLIFRRDKSGRVVSVIERRKFNDLRLERLPAAR